MLNVQNQKLRGTSANLNTKDSGSCSEGGWNPLPTPGRSEHTFANPDRCLPTCAQGALVLETRTVFLQPGLLLAVVSCEANYSLPTHQGCGQVVAFLLAVLRHLTAFLACSDLSSLIIRNWSLIFFTGHFFLILLPIAFLFVPKTMEKQKCYFACRLKCLSFSASFSRPRYPACLMLCAALPH